MGILRLILSQLLFRANSVAKDDMVAAPRSHFYSIKDRILKKYGQVVGQDIQYIEGKECWSCDGTGVYMNFYHNRWHHETCYKCNAGWYKRPTWVLLDRVQFGKFIFHQPVQKIYSPVTPYFREATIKGYIDHKRQKYGEECLMIWYIVFDRYAAKRLWQSWGVGLRTYWYWPSNWLRTLANLSKGRNSNAGYAIRHWWAKKPWSIVRKVNI